MLLGHGTSIEVALASKTKGLAPRGTNRKSLWEIESAQDAIYLSSAYCLHFAMYAAQQNDSDRAAIIGINSDSLEERYLMADEDALEQAYRLSKGDFFPVDLTELSMEDRTLWFSKNLLLSKTLGYNYTWSLSVLGTCAYTNEITSNDIDRIVVVKDLKSFWWLRFFDPIISIQNFHFMGKTYQTSQLVLMGKLEDAYLLNEKEPAMVEWLDKIISPHVEILT